MVKGERKRERKGRERGRGRRGVVKKEKGRNW